MKHGGVFSNLLQKGILVWVGDISGEAYLIHELVLIYLGISMRKALGMELMGIFLWIRMIVGLGVTLMVVFIWRKFQVHWGEKFGNVK